MTPSAGGAGGRPLRVRIVGGSLVGLTAALLLRDAGCEVDVHERSRAPLEGRGVGIVLHPVTVRYLRERSGVDLAAVSTSTAWHRFLDRDGAVVAEHARRHAFTGYDTLYRALLGAFGRDRYKLGSEAVELLPGDDRPQVRFATGDTAAADLVLAADGVSSWARRTVLPGLAPRYSGYVGWRAVAEERELSPAAREALGGALTYHLGDRTHALTYPIPHYDGSVAPGQRLINLVWYRNVAPGDPLAKLLTDRTGRRREVSLPPGSVRAEQRAELVSAAGATLPPVMAEVVARAREPFVQVILDLEVPRMAVGRVCLLGDAAFVVRPHAAAATAKGADDAWALAGALASEAGDVGRALAAWEPGRLALGRALLARNRALGEGAQLRGDWVPGDPALAFGLHEPGDSADLHLF